MGKQGVTAVENVCNGIDLMRPQCDLRIDSREIQVAAVILAGRMLLNFSLYSLVSCSRRSGSLQSNQQRPA